MSEQKSGSGSPLVDFLLERVAEDEEIALCAICQCGGPVCTLEESWYHLGEAMRRLDSRANANHVLRWSPARAVAECEAKRSVIDGFIAFKRAIGVTTQHTASFAVYDSLLRTLAKPYKEHPDYRQEWAA